MPRAGSPQGYGHIRGLLISSRPYHPVDTVQGIIEEMRVELGLRHFILCIL